MLRQVHRCACATLLMAGLSGCAASTEFNPGKSSAEMTPTQLAAFAATAKYPSTQETAAKREIAVAAIINKDKNTIKLYNFTGQPVREAKLWVNHNFVAKVDGIPPLARAVIDTDKLYDSFGNTFAKQKIELGSLELQTDDGLYTLRGPAVE